MKPMRPFALAAIALFATVLPAAAAAPVQDGAGLLSPSTVRQLNQQISNFTAQTGKQIVVITAPSLNGSTVAAAAQSVFSSQDINGVLIFIAKAERRDIILTDNATAQFFPPQTLLSIRQSMESAFRDGDFDGGITTAVGGILNVFRAHLNSAPGAGTQRTYPARQQYAYPRTRQGAHIPVFVIILLAVVGFLVLRSIFRAMSGPRYYGGSPGAPGPGPGYGGYGYGGYGGGGFWSGLLGGLGGAWLGNEMFGNQGGNIMGNQGGGMMPMDSGGSWGGGADAGGWANDAGQADMGGASSGDFSGGGFGGFGGGDMGGGFGGGDMGGGW